MDREVAASTVAQGVDGRLEEREPWPRVRTPAPGPAPGGPLRRRCVSHRKMKKFIRYLRLKPQSPSDRDEHAKRRRRYEADFTLEPFAGLTPEYMEMSTWARGRRPRPRGRALLSPLHTAGAQRRSPVTCSRVTRREGAHGPRERCEETKCVPPAWRPPGPPWPRFPIPRPLPSAPATPCPARPALAGPCPEHCPLMLHSLLLLPLLTQKEKNLEALEIETVLCLGDILCPRLPGKSRLNHGQVGCPHSARGLGGGRPAFFPGRTDLERAACPCGPRGQRACPRF